MQPGIGRDNSFGLSCGHGLHFLFEEMLGHLGMGDVVYPGAAATPIGAFHFLQLSPGIAFSKFRGWLRTRWPWAR